MSTSRNRSTRQHSRRPNGRERPPLPQSTTLPGTLAQHLHDIGVGRRQMPTSEAVRHHYIAQMLLREWLDPTQARERLWQLDKQSGEIVPQSTATAASVRRHYRVQHRDGGESDHLEGFLALVEGHAAASLRRMRAEPAAIDEGDRANSSISLLLALQDARTPAGHARRIAQLSTFARSWAVTWLSDASKCNARYRKAHPTASWQEADASRLETLRELRDGELVLKAPKELGLRLMLETWLEIAGTIHGLRWKVLRASEGEFVIGDHPMVMRDPTPKFPFSGNGRQSSPTAYTMMPLGPDMCLRLDQAGGWLEQRTASRQIAAINLLSYGWAERFVYARSRSVLERLHQDAQDRPDDAPSRRPDPQVLMEEADPNDPSVGAEHPPGYPRGIWYDPPDEPARFMAYKLQYTDGPRTVIIGDQYVDGTLEKASDLAIQIQVRDD